MWGQDGGFRGRTRLQRIVTALGLALPLILAAPDAGAAGSQSRSFVVSFFAQQFTNNPGDCPGGVNPEDERGQIAVALRTMG